MTYEDDMLVRNELDEEEGADIGDPEGGDDPAETDDEEEDEAM